MLDFASGLAEIVSGFGNGRGNGGGYRGDEGGVDLLIDGGGAGVGDFRRDRVLLLVDVILDFRLFGGSGHRFDQAGAEILGQHDGCIVFAGLHAVYGLFLIVYEAPAEFVVLLEFLDDLPARIEMADQIVGGALVFIGYGHLQIAGG